MKHYKNALSGAVVLILCSSALAATPAPGSPGQVAPIVTSKPVRNSKPVATSKSETASLKNVAPTLKLDALLMVDLTWYKGTSSLQNATTPAGKYADETGFRRARIAAQGKLHRDVDYNATFDLADILNKGNSVKLNQAFVSYSGFRPIKLKFGQFLEPFSLEAMTSSRHSTFMERGLPSIFHPGQNLGAGVSAEPTDNLIMEGGLFKHNINSSGQSKTSSTGRIAYALLNIRDQNDQNQVIHLGASASYRKPENNRNRYAQYPEAAFVPNYFSSTVTDADSIILQGMEAAVVSGALSVQGEYIQANITRLNGKAERSYDGYYLYASWFLTGESRPYSNGKFTGIKPEHKFNFNQGQWGAWELAVRHSQVKSDNGKKLRDATVGINWYLNRDVRFMVNYIRTNYETDLTQGSANIIAVRGQVAF